MGLVRTSQAWSRASGESREQNGDKGSSEFADFFFSRLSARFASGFFPILSGSLPPSLGALWQASSRAVRSALRTDTGKEHFRVRDHIFANVFLWLNRQSSSFNDAFRVEKVKLAMYLLLFTGRVIGEKNSPWCVI